ncbi:hypothetical protein SS50377_25450 [Spironucleus salmonicida]|uniref:TOG domain-containing protein n=1 Tax=Spironucleus salmonicida TaxID=348837 RepID=V6LKV5_9EUKA|nr:hypothetical protein SS50377_25450 [Spironucleus salmonicida]|eukprot:EST44998.1 hypothetical protein SS50377_15017 [Spironucleus salmonicida]
MDTEYAEEEVHFERPTDLVSALESKSIKDRLNLVNYVQQELNKQNFEPLFMISELAPLLAKEQNAAISSKSLILLLALIQSQKYSALKVLSLSLEHAGNIKQQIKNIIKEIAVLSSIENFDEAIHIMSRFLTHKQPKVVMEVSLIISDILQKSSNLGPTYVKLLVPGLQHVKEEVRKPCVDVLIVLGQKIGKQAILQLLTQNKLTDAQISTFSHLFSEIEGIQDDNIDDNIIQDQNAKYQYDIFDETKPLKFPLVKNFEERLKNAQWKERKAILEESIEQINKQIRIDPSSYDLPKLIFNIKNIILEEKQVQVVQLAEKLISSVAIKVGPISTITGIKVLLQTVQNRVKEKKYAIVNGYHVFIQSILVRAFQFKDIFYELFTIAIPHKNQEVKEELLRVIKVIAATSIVYLYKLQDEDSKINILSNDAFPSPIFPTTEEEIPMNGEKSYGMQLNNRSHRQKTGKGLCFIDYFNFDGSVNLQVQFQQDIFIMFFDLMDKLLNDTNASIRDLSKKTIAMFIVFHIAEGNDAIKRSEQDENLLFVYNQMYQVFIQYISGNRRKNEILVIIKDISKFLQDFQSFSSFFEGQAYAQQPSYQEADVTAVNKVLTSQKINKAIKSQGNSKQNYQQRKELNRQFLVDPCNQQAPLTPQMLEEIYQQLSSITLNAQQLFVKGVISSAFGPSGTFKSIQENIPILLSSNLNESKDIVLRYLSLLLADGFVAKSQASPLQTKLFSESLDKLVYELQQNGISLNYYDLECILPVMLQKFEQQQSSQLKSLILTSAEKLISVAENLEDLLILSLNIISKSWKIQIRQVTTKVSILRFISGLASLFVQQNLLFNSVQPIHIVSLQQFYVYKGAENFSLTDSYIVQQIPIKITSQKQLSLYLINTFIQNCQAEIKDKLVNSALKFVEQREIHTTQQFNDVQQHTVKQQQINTFTKQNYQDIQQQQPVQNNQQQSQKSTIQVQQPVIQTQQNTYNSQQQPTSYQFNQPEGYVQHQTYQEIPVQQQKFIQPPEQQYTNQRQVFQQQPNFREPTQGQFNNPQQFSTPSAVQAQGKYNNQKSTSKNVVSFNEKNLNTPMNFSVNKSHIDYNTSNQNVQNKSQQDLVEELADFPDILIDIPLFDSPQVRKNINLEIKTPNLKEIMVSQENLKYKELYNNDLNKVQNFNQLIFILKNFIYSLRNEPSSIYLESQVEKLSVRLFQLFNAHIQLSLLQNGPSKEFYILSKYIVMALSELSSCELFHQSHIYKSLFQTLLPTSAIFGSSIAREWSFNDSTHILGLIQGLFIQVTEISDINRYAVAILQILHQFTSPFNDGQIINIIASQQHTEQFQFLHVFLTNLISKIQPVLIFQLNQDINQRIKQAQQLNLVQDVITQESQIRPQLIQFWNGAEQVIFQLHLNSLNGNYKFIDQIMQNLSENVVIICGKVPQNSNLRTRNSW